jgi:hypothetical protein
MTMTPPARSVRNESGSERNPHPSRTAMTGFTYAYVPTSDVGTTRSSQT